MLVGRPQGSTRLAMEDRRTEQDRIGKEVPEEKDLFGEAPEEKRGRGRPKGSTNSELARRRRGLEKLAKHYAVKTSREELRLGRPPGGGLRRLSASRIAELALGDR